jgi:hypothetical protein
MANPLLREGPLPAVVHGAIEYLAAIVFIGAPTVLKFESAAATAVSVIVGVVVLIVTASSALPTGLIKAVPPSIHVALDFVLSIFLIATPFLFGFVADSTALAFFIVLGVVHLLVTIATRFESAPRGSRRGEGRA